MPVTAGCWAGLLFFHCFHHPPDLLSCLSSAALSPPGRCWRWVRSVREVCAATWKSSKWKPPVFLQASPRVESRPAFRSRARYRFLFSAAPTAAPCSPMAPFALVSPPKLPYHCGRPKGGPKLGRPPCFQGSHAAAPDRDAALGRLNGGHAHARMEVVGIRSRAASVSIVLEEVAGC